MYISTEGLHAIHRQRVNEALARAEKRRLIEEAKQHAQARSPERPRARVLRGRMGSLVRALARA
jgi:hypothetical protein